MASMDVPADRAPAVKPVAPAVVRPTYITWLTLAFMTTASVASLRSAPTMAVYGLTCVFLYLVPAIIFLLPQSLVAAELASGWTGGVFRWVSEGLSPAWGLLVLHAAPVALRWPASRHSGQPSLSLRALRPSARSRLTASWA
jgi:hypothetical protein